MNEGFPYADIVILALIAGFILLRLRSVLGNKSGTEDYLRRVLPPAAPKPDAVVQVDAASLKPKPRDDDPYLASLNDSALADALRQIRDKDPQFSATTFLQGARTAFEMVFDAFVKGDKQTLKMLMSDPIFQTFGKEIDARQKQESKSETTLVSVAAKELTQAALSKNIARLTVHFISEQVTVTRDASGAIIEGDPSELHHVEDEWSFERDITSKNPNWKIVET